jgi:predicted nucleotide-binding protein
MALPENRPQFANLTPEQMRQGIKRLKYCIAEVEAFDLKVNDMVGLVSACQVLEERLKSALAQVFVDSTVEYKRYSGAVNRCWIARPDRLGSQEMLRGYRAELLSALNKALSFLTEELDVATAGQSQAADVVTKVAPDDGGSMSTVPASKVFIVHGHDRAARSEVARFIEQLKLEAIILDEQPSQGRTIIEKFEDCAEEVGFAVVIMTPDDVAGPIAAPSSATRARQNVIFELGYFAGALGRDKTCVIRKGDVEIPSDLYGILYIDLDNGGGWKVELARELKAAGLKVNPDGML